MLASAVYDEINVLQKELEERQPFEGVAHYLARMVALRKTIEEK